MLPAELDPSLRGAARPEGLDDGFSPPQPTVPTPEPAGEALPAEPTLPEKSPF